MVLTTEPIPLPWPPLGRTSKTYLRSNVQAFHSDCHTEDKMHTPRSSNTTPSHTVLHYLHEYIPVCMFFFILYSPSLSLYIGFIHAQCGKLCKYQSIKILHFQSHHLPHVLSVVLFLTHVSENVFILPARRLSLL